MLWKSAHSRFPTFASALIRTSKGLDRRFLPFRTMTLKSPGSFDSERRSSFQRSFPGSFLFRLWWTKMFWRLCRSRAISERAEKNQPALNKQDSRNFLLDTFNVKKCIAWSLKENRAYQFPTYSIDILSEGIAMVLQVAWRKVPYISICFK